jgi:hypothetical protein
VLAGQLDVGFITSSALAAFPNSSRLKVINSIDYSPSYNLPASTALSPGWGLVAYPHVDPALKAAVLSALLRLAPPHPAAVSGGYAGWEVARGYEGVRMALQQTGVMAADPTGKGQQCSWAAAGWTYYDMAGCPPGYFKVPERVAAQNCRDDGMVCRAPVCWCRVCRCVGVGPGGEHSCDNPC